MASTKHLKIKNTGILFELLTRQITADVLNGKDNSVAIKTMKNFFSESTELGKELLDKIIEETKDVAKVESKPKFEGRQIVMIIQPL